MNRLAVAALLFTVPHGAGACRLSIAPGLLQGRVAAIALTIDGVAVQAASIKPGWTLSITNDPSWRARVTGRAIVGAAFLSGPDILSMLTFLPEPGASCGDILNDGHSASVTLTFYRRDRLVPVSFGRSDLGFTP